MGFFDALKKGLEKTKKLFTQGADDLFRSIQGKLDDDFYDELEELLILSDVGASASSEIIEKLKEKVKEDRIFDGDGAKQALKDILVEMISFDDSGLKLNTKPSVLLVIGVNGVGKTTSIAKISKCLIDDKKSVTLAAADTFRAAAIDQLEVWAGRVGAKLIKQNEGADPAAVVYDGVQAAKARNVDIMIVDTAGRLHNKAHLMEELRKISRVVERDYPEAKLKALLVIDATTGQNGLVQAKAFKDIADIDGIVLTKLDGTAKGGIAVAIANELNMPVRYIGLGEQIDDMQPFDAKEFIEAIFG